MAKIPLSEAANQALLQSLRRGDFRLEEREVEVGGERARFSVSSSLERQLAAQSEALPPDRVVQFDNVPPDVFPPPPDGGLPFPSPGPGLAAGGGLAEIDSYVVKTVVSLFVLASVGPIARDGILTRVFAQVSTQTPDNPASGLRVWISSRDATGLLAPVAGLDRNPFQATNSDTQAYPYLSASVATRTAEKVAPSTLDLRMSAPVRQGEFLTIDVAGGGSSVGFAIFEVTVGAFSENVVLREKIIERITERSMLSAADRRLFRGQFSLPNGLVVHRSNLTLGEIERMRALGFGVLEIELQSRGRPPSVAAVPEASRALVELPRPGRT